MLKLFKFVDLFITFEMQHGFEHGTCRKSSVHSLICVNDLLCKHNPKCLVQIHVISHYIAHKHESMHLIPVLILKRCAFYERYDDVPNQIID